MKTNAKLLSCRPGGNHVSVKANCQKIKGKLHAIHFAVPPEEEQQKKPDI